MGTIRNAYMGITHIRIMFGRFSFLLVELHVVAIHLFVAAGRLLLAVTIITTYPITSEMAMHQLREKKQTAYH